MKILKIVGLSLVALLGLFLLVGLFLPREVTAQRSRTIAATPEQVFAVISDVSTWEAWSPWAEKDPTMQITPGETMQGEGASYSWTSEEQGNGEQTITSVDAPRSMTTHIVFEGMGEADGNWQLVPVESGTEVTWGFQSEVPYPWNTFFYLQGGSNAVAEDFAYGLERLATYLRENPSAAAPTYKINEIELEERHYLVHREAIAMDAVNDFFQTQMPKLGMAMAEQNITISGTPSGLFFEWDEANQRADLAVAIPAPAGTALDGYTTYTVPAGKALTIDYMGPYEGTMLAHQAMEAYMTKNKLAAAQVVIEEYVTDPESEPDPADWLTRIIYVL